MVQEGGRATRPGLPGMMRGMGRCEQRHVVHTQGERSGTSGTTPVGRGLGWGSGMVRGDVGDGGSPGARGPSAGLPRRLVPCILRSMGGPNTACSAQSMPLRPVTLTGSSVMSFIDVTVEKRG